MLLGTASFVSGLFAQTATRLSQVSQVYLDMREINMASSCEPNIRASLKRNGFPPVETIEQADAVLAITLEAVESTFPGDAIKFVAQLKGLNDVIIWENDGKERSLLSNKLPCSDITEEIVEEMHDETT